MFHIIETKLFLIILFLLNFIISTSEEYIIKKLDEFSIIKPTWEIDKNYIYYLEVDNYELDDENIIQIINEDSSILNNLTIFELNETFIIDNNSDINEAKENIVKKNIKFRLKPKRYYYEILIKKRNRNQKYFVLLIEPNLIDNNTYFELTVSSKIPKINMQASDISEGKFFSQAYEMHARIEKFIKFNISNISLENHNLILFVLDQGVSSFYFNNLSGINKRTTSLYIYEKNSTQENNFIIYLSLLGQANKTKFQIKLDDYDIIYTYSNSRKDIGYYIEKLNCTKDFYIFESYFDVNDIVINEIFYTDTIPIYGDYDLFYFDINSNNITNIFNPNYNNTKKIERTMPVNSELCGMKLTCKNPTFIGIKYLQKNINLNISEGKEIICVIENKKYTDNYIFLNDLNKEYKFYMGFYKLPDNETCRVSFYGEKNFDPNVIYGDYFLLSTLLNDTEIFKKVYYGKGRENLGYYITSKYVDINLKILFINMNFFKFIYYINTIKFNKIK